MAWDLFGGRGIIPQLDGTTFGGDNCACATLAMHLMSERQGRKPSRGLPWPPTGASIRRASGDRSGGLKASQVDAVANDLYGIDPDFRIASVETVREKLVAGYAATFLHSYGPISDAGFSGSPGFRGNHSSLLTGLRRSAATSEAIKNCCPLYDGRRPGIPEGPQWLPLGAIQHAGELLIIDDHGNRMRDRYGSGMLYVGFTRVPYRPGLPPTYMRYSVAFGEGSFWTYRVVNGVIQPRKSSDARQFSGATSARCGAPSVYPYPGNHPMRLVKMSAGALKGKYVAVPQGSARLIELEVQAP